MAEENARLVTALARITILENDLVAARLANDPHRTPRTPRDPTVTYTHYCWTHGPKCSHSSFDCNKKGPGHKEEATEANKLGGREKKWQFIRR